MLNPLVQRVGKRVKVHQLIELSQRGLKRPAYDERSLRDHYFAIGEVLIEQMFEETLGGVCGGVEITEGRRP
ncbi:MAG: hypothetical protein ACI9R3_000553 [Verrucomicrobiales bacterium]|jgi:hypothetical protein